MSKRIIAALAAVVFAAAGTVALMSYANDADERAFQGAELVAVLQVAERVPANTPAERLGGRIEQVELPRAAVPKGAVADRADLAGLSTTVDLEPGEQVLLSRFAKGGAAGDSPSPSAIPVGMQALTVPVDVARAVGGALKVGDTVGVIASYQTKEGDGITRVIGNRVLIIRIAEGGPVAEGQTGGSQLVTFAVETRAAGKIVNALEYGKVYLTEQNEATRFGKGGSISRDDVAG